MKRRIVILVGTFLVILVAFGLYVSRQLPIMEDWWNPLMGLGKKPELKVPPGDKSELDLESGTGLYIESRDPAGRLESIYIATDWHKKPDGTYLVETPVMIRYQSDGQRVYLIGDHGQITADRVAGGYDVRRGKLWAADDRKVKVYIDRSDTAVAVSRTAPREVFVELGKRPESLIRINVNHVEFDNDQLTLTSESDVVIWSPQADLVGRGLDIRWNESPRELRSLTILEGQYMAVYNMSEDTELFSLPGRGEEASAAPAAAGGALGAKGAVGAASRPATAPGSAPATGPAADKVKRKNVYQAMFSDSVNVDYGQRHMHFAKEVVLEFEWEGRRSRRELRGRGARAAEKPASRPARPSGGGSRKRAGGQSKPASKTPKPKKAKTKAGTEPLMITWNGPLTLTPVRYTPTPSGKRYTVQGTGNQIVLSDSETTATCNRFVYQRPEQVGRLDGTEDEPVELAFAGGQTIVCPTIHFDRPGGRARLEGRGYMTSLTSRRGEVGLGGPLASRGGRAKKPTASAPATSKAPEYDRISWAQAVDVTFAQHQTKRPDGSTRKRQYVKEAVFHRGVKLVQGASGDFMHCDQLQVWMARNPSGRAIPTRAVASGSETKRVHARQEGSDILADSISVTFDETVVNSSRGPKSRIRPQVVVAAGNVELTDRQEDQVITATSERLDSQLIDRTAVLMGAPGRPARIAQGPNALSGRQIHLKQRSQSVLVFGEGKLDFETEKGLDGVKQDKPRPVRISWEGGMEFRGKLNRAVFADTVRLRSEMEEMDCDELRVLFGKAPASGKDKAEAGPPKPTTAPAAAAKDKPSTRRVIDMEQFSRRINMILARRNVAVRSRREDEKNHLLRRLELAAAEQLVYDVPANEMTVSGPGSLVSEDYRLPEEEEKKQPAASTAANIQRPSQTAFQWGKSMRLNQNKRRVVLEQSVVMVHRSGDKIKLTEDLNLQPMGEKLPEGRLTAMTCRKLLAEFGEPEDKDKEKGGATRPGAGKKPPDEPVGYFDMGPRLGPLELFQAISKVNMKDGPWQLIGQKLIYERRRDILVIWGYLPGESRANATLYYEDRDAGRSQNWSSPKIIWYRKNDRIKTEEGTGGGVR